MKAGDWVKLIGTGRLAGWWKYLGRCSGHEDEAFVRTHQPHTLDMCVLLLINFVSSLIFNIYLGKQVFWTSGWVGKDWLMADGIALDQCSLSTCRGLYMFSSLLSYYSWEEEKASREWTDSWLLEYLISVPMSFGTLQLQLESYLELWIKCWGEAGRLQQCSLFKGKGAQDGLQSSSFGEARKPPALHFSFVFSVDVEYFLS